MEVEDVAVAVDQGAGGGEFLQERPFGQLAEGEFSGDSWLAGNQRKSCTLCRHGRQVSAQDRMLSTMEIFFMLIEFQLTIERGKQVIVLPDRLRGAQKEKTVRIQRVVEEGNEFFLQLLAHIDQHIAATDEIYF